MACQKGHKQGRIKVMVNIQSPIPTSLLFVKDVGMDKALYIAGVYNLIANELAAVKLTIPLLKETLDNAQNGSWWSLTNLTQTF